MKRLLIAIALILIFPAASYAEDAPHAVEEVSYNRAEQIAHVLNGSLPADSVFSTSFLKAVSPTQLESLTAQLMEQHGAIIGIDDITYTGSGSASFDIVFENARGAATIQLESNPPFLVAGFRIAAVTPTDDSPIKILQDFSELSGQTSFGVYMVEGSELETIMTERAYQQLAIGSTFKLYVLSALAREIDSGKRRWSDVVPLNTHSIPSGQMQDWPLGSPVTLHTLATMMIAISDNTATDVLMYLLGREAIEQEMIASGHSEPARNMPMLTTVEFFALKNDPDRIAAFTAENSAGRRALLAEWEPTLTAGRVDVGKLIGAGPTAIDSIEWFASNEDIARILVRLRDLGDQTVMDILGINTVLSDTELKNWQYAGYKGGSETGVLNLSWLLQDRQSRWFVISASWNDPQTALDDTKLILISKRLMGMLQQ